MPIRIATFNVENLDDKLDQNPPLVETIKFLRPQLIRLRADIICLQEIHGQETPGQPRDVKALKQVLENTLYANFNIACTKTTSNEVLDERNLVVLSRFPITDQRQFLNDIVPAPQYQTVTALPLSESTVKTIRWERPIFHVTLDIGTAKPLHIINLHFKSRLPVDVAGQKLNRFTWKTSAGWAEGSFLASMKRVGQALETRILLDQLFESDPEAMIVIAGDFNAHPDEVPVEGIRGAVDSTDNPLLAFSEMIPCEHTIPEPSRYSFIHRGQKRMLDHMLISRQMLMRYKHAELHNETLRDESLPLPQMQNIPKAIMRLLLRSLIYKCTGGGCHHNFRF
ncbi:MAG: endonuclease/exonuclease/phosphatase family protein [Ferruginibacter sp.]